MTAVEHNAVLVVVYIRRILEAPRTVIYSDRNNTVVFSCRMIDSSCISLILRAEETFRIAAGFRKFRCCDRFRIFLRFGKIDRDIYCTIFAVYCPFLILLYTVATDIVTVLAEFVDVVCCFLRILRISVPELLLHLCRTGHQAVHDLCIKKVTVNNAVLNDSSAYCFVQKSL